MNRIATFIAIAAIIVLPGMPSDACAQVTAAASVGATIVTPMTVSKESDLSFENVAVESTVVGSRHLGSAHTSSVKSRFAQKTVEASFTITGNPEYAYSISIPAYITVSTRKHTFAIGTECCAGSGMQMLSKDGKNSVSVTGVILSWNAEARNLVAYNDEELPNGGFPVTVNNN